MILLNQMMHECRLYKYIEELEKIILQEEIDKMRWEYWLHRVYDMNFDEYVRQCELSQSSGENESSITIEEVVKQSYTMLNDFKP